MLSTPADGIVAFTLGEVIGDTLYVHIEKMNHLVNGAGETVNKLFAELMTGHHPEVRYINREEDVGDPGLRHAKESYHPSASSPNTTSRCDDVAIQAASPSSHRHVCL